MNIYNLLLISYSTITKVATNTGINVIDLCLFRMTFNFAFAIAAVAKAGKHIIHDVPKQHRFALFVRTLFGLCAIICLIYAVKLLPMFIVSIVSNTMPFWASLLGYLILSESVAKVDIICMIGCFAGVVLIAFNKRDTLNSSSKLKDGIGTDGNFLAQ